MQLWDQEQVQTLIPAIGIMIVLAVVLRLVLGNKSEKIRRIPLQVIAVSLLILEFFKQAISFSRGYDLYHIPLHFCSLFLYVLPVMAFYRGKHQQKVNAVGAAICAALSLLMLIYPALIYSGSNVNQYFTDFMSFHTVTFHNIAMFAFPALVALRLHTPKKGDWKAVAVFTVGFAAVAGTMAQILKTNYANFYSCNIAPLEAVRQSIQGVLGVTLTQVIYVLIVGLLHVGFTLLSYNVYRLVRKLFAHKKAEEATL